MKFSRRIFKAFLFLFPFWLIAEANFPKDSEQKTSILSRSKPKLQTYPGEHELKKYMENFYFEEYNFHRFQAKDLYYTDDSRDYVKTHIVKRGVNWQEHLHNRFKKYAKPGSVILNIGGKARKQKLKMTGGQGVVRILEPMQKTFCELAINMHLKDCKTMLHRENFTATDKWIEINIPKEEWTNHAQQEGSPKLIRLDNLKLKNLSFIKMEAEGFEMEIVRGGKATIQRDQPVMIIEFFDHLDKQDNIEEIEGYGYVSTPLDTKNYLFLPLYLLGLGSKGSSAIDQQLLSRPGNNGNFKEAHSNKKPISVAWEGPFLSCGILSNINRSLTKPLSKNPFIKVTRVGPNPQIPNEMLLPELEEMAEILHAKAPDDTEITVRNNWPPDWSPPVKGKWVLMQPWELGSIPREWVKKIKDVNEIWASSNFVKKEYIASGVPAAKVHVVPEGFDPERFHPNVKPYPLKTTKKFKFLFIGGTIYRKGSDLLLAAYLNAFSAEDDVCLVIKDLGKNNCYAVQTHGNQIKAAQAQRENAEIIYFDEEMSIDEVASLFTACDCFVYPYRAESFALPVLQAMASGLAPLVTAGGPTDDFVSERCGWFIPAKKEILGPTIGQTELAGDGWLLEPDIEILSLQMRWIANHPADVKTKGAAAAKEAKENWTWQHAAAIAAKRLLSLD